ncbi:DUF1893 domain-containing protein [uncultured Duncaniella sp.]|uniref:DUF1893 domain-containing protein n=1 Tax=uncultured Duncaniella sp. TaxID=2768039 RepID=UPI0025A9AE1F|nr:DUF1893 domain-containing protein [uncultured Duncaniella sp.]
MIPAAEYRQTAIDRLHAVPCSCVIVRGDSVTVCHGRGVSDLYRIYTTQPWLLSGAFVADRVIGKGAAALMIAGDVAGVYTDLISVQALELFRSVGIEPEFARSVPNIINRTGDGICPVETLCRDCVTASACIPLIADFIEKINQKH